MSKANKLNCYGCLILGEDEWKEKKIIWKNFQTGKQETISINNIDKFLERFIKDLAKCHNPKIFFFKT